MNIKLKLFMALTICSCFAGIWLVGTVEKRLRCVDRDTIDAVYFMQKHTVEKKITLRPYEVSFCDIESLYAVHRDLPTVIKNMKSSVENFESFTKSLKWNVEPIKIFLYSGKDFLFSIKKNEIHVNFKALAAKRQMFKALVSSWLLHVNSSLEKDVLLLEAWSDFFTAVSYGGKSAVNPVTGSRYNYKSNWTVVDFLYSSSEICLSPWVPNTYLSFCQVVDNEKTNNLSMFSLRPVLVQVFWENYINTKVKNRITWLRALSLRLQRRVSIDKKVTVEAPLEKDSYDLSNFSNWLEYLDRRLSVYFGDGTESGWLSSNLLIKYKIFPKMNIVLGEARITKGLKGNERLVNYWFDASDNLQGRGFFPEKRNQEVLDLVKNMLFENMFVYVCNGKIKDSAYSLFSTSKNIILLDYCLSEGDRKTKKMFNKGFYSSVGEYFRQITKVKVIHLDYKLMEKSNFGKEEVSDLLKIVWDKRLDRNSKVSALKKEILGLKLEFDEKINVYKVSLPESYLKAIRL